MKRAMIGLVLAGCAMPAMAGETGAADKRATAYQQCMVLAAVKGSYSDVASDQIHGAAQSACGRYGRQPAAVPAFGSNVGAATFASWVDALRERRRLTYALYGTPSR